MKKNITTICFYFLCCFITMISGCKRQDDWLNAKRLSSELTPRTISDYQAILNNDIANGNFTSLALGSTDNLYLTNTAFTSVAQYLQDVYLWKRSVWDDQNGVSLQWNNLFAIIEEANVVLDGLQGINPNVAGYNNLKGQALFYRCICNYTLAQLFCKPYNLSTAKDDLGLPLRLSSDVNIIYQRSSLQDAYNLMISDATDAISFLDSQPVLYNFRPYKYAAMGLLSKIYFVMGDYKNAELFATNVLTNVPALLDFNSSLVSLSSTYRFPVNGINNLEILFFASSLDCAITRPFATNKAFVDPAFYSSYNNNDLRKTMFFAQSGTDVQFRGTYTGGSSNFCGIATNEIYLIRAESRARLGNVSEAMDDLNTLLRKRYRTGTFIAFTAGDSKSAITTILQERRKELPFTADIRWEDLRRLNPDPNYQQTITRTLNGITYNLQPNDPRYVFPIPTSEIQLSGLVQNPN